MNFKPALFLQDLKIALRSLTRAKGLAITVILTLALGIGANAAIFTLVRGVLLRPLVNRDEDRLIYIRQSALGIGNANTYFSIPELKDIESGARSITAFGDFSTISFTMVGLGEPREVQAGVAGGTYFEVMGLHPVLGRLIGPHDDGPKADGVVVLTYRFWTSALHSDPNVIGKTVRLGSGPMGTRSGTIIGVLEPCIPYPADTEIIANVVTSPHHLSATMVDGRVHRMTELFGRLAPGATLEQARAELRTVYNSMTAQHPEGNYSKQADFQISATRLREQITSGARTVLLVLLAASGLVFIIAVSNVANLILARSVRREGELSIRAALGASTSTLRRTLLAESLLLCGAGALLGVLIARPMVAILARYASRFSIRALDLTVDSSLLWVGAGLAIIAAILLAYVPRLPSATSSQGFGLATGSVRITGGTNRRLRLFAMTQIAASFLLLAGASMLLKTLLDMQNARTVLDANRVLAVNVPVDSYGKKPEEINHFYEETIRRVSALPGVDAVAVGDAVPWRDTQFNFQLQFSGDGHVKGPGEEDPRTQVRTVSPGFFAALHVPILEGRDFNDLDRQDKEPVVVISQSVAQRMFPGRDSLNRHLWWTDPVIKFIGMESTPRRIVGVVADVDDTHVIPSPTLTVYDPMEQQGLFGGRLFVHTHSDPYALVTPIVQLIRTMSADQPVEKAATLEDIRAEVLTPDRLNSLVFGGFALVALAIAIVGVAGVLAFSVSARTREFGIRLAIGSQPSRLLAGVIREGAVMAAVGIVVGAVGGYILARLAGSYLLDMKMPSPLPVLASAFILLVAAVAASALPAARAARVDVIQALRAE
jgi:putative ABC transport system permease protein